MPDEDEEPTPFIESNVQLGDRTHALDLLRTMSDGELWSLHDACDRVQGLIEIARAR